MIQSLEKAILLLNEMGNHATGIGVRELSRKVGLKPTSVQNLLTTCRAHGNVEFESPTKRYRIGLAVIRLAEMANPLRRLIDFVRPFGEELFALTGETVVALTLLNGECVALYRRRSDQPLSASEPGDSVAQPHVMAAGRLLLAYADPAYQAHYLAEVFRPAPVENLPPTAPALQAEFEQIRCQGYCQTLNTAGSGVGALAVPVFDCFGQVALALAGSAPLARFQPERRAWLRERLQNTANEMQRRLGAAAQTQERTHDA